MVWSNDTIILSKNWAAGITFMIFIFLDKKWICQSTSDLPNCLFKYTILAAVSNQDWKVGRVKIEHALFNWNLLHQSYSCHTRL